MGNRLTGGKDGGLHTSPMVSDFVSNCVVATGSDTGVAVAVASGEASVDTGGTILSSDDGVRAGTASACMEVSVLYFKGGARSGAACDDGSILAASGGGVGGSSGAWSGAVI